MMETMIFFRYDFVFILKLLLETKNLQLVVIKGNLKFFVDFSVNVKLEVVDLLLVLVKDAV